MSVAKQAEGALAVSEMKEFASFPSATQRYLRRSLDVGLDRGDAVNTWARDSIKASSIRAQVRVYGKIGELRDALPDDSSPEAAQDFMSALTSMTAFDLSQERINGFGAYRFLYERLLGAAVRPWLPAAFCAAAAMPNLHPERRRTLLKSISEAAATAPGWSNREPAFYPEWVDKVDAEALPN